MVQIAALLPIALQLAQYAPALLRYLGVGEASTQVVERVVDVAQTVAGAKTPQEALAAIAASAELQTRFQLEVLRLDSELQRLHLEDRQSARWRDVELRRMGQSNRRADLMVAAVVIGLVACLVVLGAYRERIPGEVVGIVSTIAGVFGACLKDAFAFEFGTSRGSEQKQATIDELLRRKV